MSSGVADAGEKRQGAPHDIHREHIDENSDETSSVPHAKKPDTHGPGVGTGFQGR